MHAVQFLPTTCDLLICAKLAILHEYFFDKNVLDGEKIITVCQERQ